MKTVDYVHDANLHTLLGAKASLSRLFEARLPASVLDVGCGRGTWLKAALDLGVQDVCGVDGVGLAQTELLFPAENFLRIDLTTRWDIGRKFDLCISLEVAEHLPEQCASALVEALTRHSNTVLFSAAIPNQGGQHHVNCQWPSYWQGLFNSFGFACDDSFRWTIWDVAEIEPWYRENIFTAHRAPDVAGNEPRINAVIHPDMLQHKHFGFSAAKRDEWLAQLSAGSESASWYVTLLMKSLAGKLQRKLFRHQG
jgi:SAM-dependent methyltransferase